MRATVAPRPPVGVSTGIAWSRGSSTVFEHAVPASRRASSVIARWSLFTSASRYHGRPQWPKLGAVRGWSARSGRASCPVNRGRCRRDGTLRRDARWRTDCSRPVGRSGRVGRGRGAKRGGGEEGGGGAGPGGGRKAAVGGGGRGGWGRGAGAG